MGRDSQLVQLVRHLDEGRPVVVFGEAGVGKTALVREAAALSGRRLLEAGALATLSWVPHLPLRRLLGYTPAGDEAYVAAEVERVAGDGFVFFDDVHWADRETRAVVPFLAGRVRLCAAVRRGDPAAAQTLDELAEAGFDLLSLEPLSDADAAELTGLLRPDLGQAAVSRLVEQTGGNPLLLEELAASGEPSESLQLALAARLRPLSPPGREAMGLLALAGRPLDVEALGAGGVELLGAGLAIRTNGSLLARHTLLAEVAAVELAEDERKKLHRRLAKLLDDPGERARHYASAGETGAALADALRAVAAAATLGERALHLELAATCASGEQEDRLRIEAASALADAGLADRAVALLDGAVSDEPAIRAHRHLYRSRVALAHTDLEQARTECEAGRALVAGSGTEIEARLALHEAQMAQTRAIVFDFDAAVARDKAVHALALAQGFEAHEAQAHALIASIGVFTQSAGWRDEYRIAHERAREDAGADIEFRIASSYGFHLLLSGELGEALEVLRAAAGRARERKLTVWDRRLRLSLAGVQWHAGDLGDALEGCQALAAEAVERGHEPEFYRCQVLSDVGRHEEALSIARALVDQTHATWSSLGEALWALTDAELAAGKPRQALEAADELLERFGGRGPTAFVQVTRAWAMHDLGLPPDRIGPTADQPLVEGAPVEFRGLQQLSCGEEAEAAASFAEAAALWQGRHFRGHLRSRWAEGEAWRLVGERTRAVDVLGRAEAVALELGWKTLLGRIRRSLRLAGARRSATRGTAGELTLREREVLELVAEGASNAEIARRLGVGRPTIEQTVRSASRKLGARTRAQAAVLAARQ